MQQCPRITYPHIGTTAALMVSLALAADKDPEKFYCFVIGCISMTIFLLLRKWIPNETTSYGKGMVRADTEKAFCRLPFEASASMYDNEPSMPL
jgi:hypothetical protein